MAARGDLVHRVSPRHKRLKWSISRESAQSWLALNGRIEDRRLARQVDLAKHDDLRQQLAAATLQCRHLEAERDRLSDEVAALRAVALQLRARNEAVTEAESHQAQATQLLLDAAQAQVRGASALRRGLSAQDDALGQFLVPGLPRDD
jgi:hypothetical protein